MKTPIQNRSAYTLIEVLIAIAISLLLLMGVTRVFQNFGTSVNDTISTLNMDQNLNRAADRLRYDLAAMTVNLNKPHFMTHTDTAKRKLAEFDFDGYFEYIEGMNRSPYDGTTVIGEHVLSSAVFIDPDRNPVGADQTVGDVDDIIMFTVRNDKQQFRGLIDNKVVTRGAAEIIWFVRGNCLYRRVLLLDEEAAVNNPQVTATNTNMDPLYLKNDISVRHDGTNLMYNKLGDLALRENRFAHWGSGNTFPYPIYTDSSTSSATLDWYFLRLPTLEENIFTSSSGNPWPIGQALPSYTAGATNPPAGISNYQLSNWDLWLNPFPFTNQDQTTGSISTTSSGYVNNPRSNRAGEDIIMRNVISFDVKIWNPYWVPTNGATTSGSKIYAPPQYVDLGQDRILDSDSNLQAVDYTVTNFGSQTNPGYGFTVKGRYNASTAKRVQKSDIQESSEYLSGTSGTSPTPDFWSSTSGHMPCVFDTWTMQYERDGIRGGSYVADPMQDDAQNWTCPPPYSERVEGLQITIRCFDPSSRNIRQVRVVYKPPVL